MNNLKLLLMSYTIKLNAWLPTIILLLLLTMLVTDLLMNYMISPLWENWVSMEVKAAITKTFSTVNQTFSLPVVHAADTDLANQASDINEQGSAGNYKLQASKSATSASDSPSNTQMKTFYSLPDLTMNIFRVTFIDTDPGINTSAPWRDIASNLMGSTGDIESQQMLAHQPELPQGTLHTFDYPNAPTFPPSNSVVGGDAGINRP